MTTNTIAIPSSLHRFNKVKKQLKSFGIELRANVMSCCRSCATAEEANISSWDIPNVWHFGGQGNRINWRKWDTQFDIHWFNHGNLSDTQKKIVVLAFEDNGFIVNWDYSDSKSISIRQQN